MSNETKIDTTVSEKNIVFRISSVSTDKNFTFRLDKKQSEMFIEKIKHID